MGTISKVLLKEVEVEGGFSPALFLCYDFYSSGEGVKETTHSLLAIP